VPELRQDPVTGKWVVIATERARRPESFSLQRGEAEVAPQASCPFCEGRESMTPPETYAIRPGGGPPDSPGWEVRVVPNKFPAFEGPMGEEKRLGLYRTRPGAGVHEVIIHSPDHRRDLEELPIEQVEKVLDTYRRRLRELCKLSFVRYLLVIVNHGRDAGASLEHPHSQIFGSPLVPPRIEEELAGTASFLGSVGACVFCRIMEEEQRAQERLIAENEHFVTFAPYASRTPFETWIIPRRHGRAFEIIQESEIPALASMLKEVLSGLSRGLGDPPLNYYLHTLPCRDDREYHWHLEILPKLTIRAGFELGSGMLINVARPEECAAFLRESKPLARA